MNPFNPSFLDDDGFWQHSVSSAACHDSPLSDCGDGSQSKQKELNSANLSLEKDTVCSDELTEDSDRVVPEHESIFQEETAYGEEYYGEDYFNHPASNDLETSQPYENLHVDGQKLNITARTMPSETDLISRFGKIEEDVRKLRLEAGFGIRNAPNVLMRPFTTVKKEKYNCQCRKSCEKLHSEMQRLKHKLSMQTIEYDSIIKEWRRRVIFLELQLAVQEP